MLNFLLPAVLALLASSGGKKTPTNENKAASATDPAGSTKAAIPGDDKIKAVIRSAVRNLKKFGINNQLLQAAILAVFGKESNFVPQSENLSYSKPERLMKVWPKKFPNAAAAAPYVKNPQALAELVYGGKYGNDKPGDGYKYRGRGFNQLTFKDGYRSIGNKIGVDLVADPDKANDPEIAAAVAAAFFANGLKYSNGKLEKMGVTDPEKINDMATAVRVAMRINAGWGTSTTGNIFKEGEAKAAKLAPVLLNIVKAI